MAKPKRTSTARPPQERTPDTMSETTTAKKGVESLSELFFNYMDASRDAQLEAQKQYYAALRNYVESVRDSIKEKPVQDAANAYARTLHQGLSSPDNPQYVQTAREYAEAAKEAEIALQKVYQDSYTVFTTEVHQTLTSSAESQKTEVEKFLKSFRDLFCSTDIKNIDAATLARIGQTLLAASWFRAQFG